MRVTSFVGHTAHTAVVLQAVMTPMLMLSALDAFQRLTSYHTALNSTIKKKLDALGRG